MVLVNIGKPWRKNGNFNCTHTTRWVSTQRTKVQGISDLCIVVFLLFVKEFALCPALEPNRPGYVRTYQPLDQKSNCRQNSFSICLQTRATPKRANTPPSVRHIQSYSMTARSPSKHLGFTMVTFPNPSRFYKFYLKVHLPNYTPCLMSPTRTKPITF